jgi:hypothetical protein
MPTTSLNLQELNFLHGLILGVIDRNDEEFVGLQSLLEEKEKIAAKVIYTGRREEAEDIAAKLEKMIEEME